MTAENGPATRRGPSSTAWWLLAYAVIIAAIALWLVPVDSGAGPLLRAITRHFPVLTYERIEWAANVVLFVPLGFLLTRILSDARWLVLPIALVTTVAIEAIQAVALPQRTSSALDVLANVTGACIGMIIAALVWRGRSHHVRSSDV